MKNILITALLIIISGSAFSQISFPVSNVLNLYTSEEVIYLETRIAFNTGKYKADDYRWEKISDSLDKRWLVTACFNGDCRNDLLQSGDFIKDFGLNDTTCFIAFHVESYGNNGRSVIKYKVINKSDTDDNALLYYAINYSSASAHDITSRDLKMVNPVKDRLILLNNNLIFDKAYIYTMDGKLISNLSIPASQRGTIEINLPPLAKGIYLLNITRGDENIYRRVIISDF